jgi:hypothetical protein
LQTNHNNKKKKTSKPGFGSVKREQIDNKTWPMERTGDLQKKVLKKKRKYEYH